MGGLARRCVAEATALPTDLADGSEADLEASHGLVVAACQVPGVPA
jgi:hypothetical protein